MKHSDPSALRRYAAAAGACLCLLFAVSSAAAQACAHLALPGQYPHERYRIRDVRVESKLDFLHAISSYLKETKAGLPLKAGGVYSLARLLPDLSAGRKMIDDKLDEAENDVDPRTRIRFVRGRIENCRDDTTPAEVDVVYRIFLTNYDAYLSHTLEEKSKEVERPADAAAEPKANGFLKVRPAAGYNRTRRLFGGGLLALSFPGGVFENVGLAAAGSPTSNAEAFDVSGERTPERALLNSLQYRFAYKHSDIPAGANRLREGTLLFQSFGASGPLGKKGLILRYGASLEGGNQQTDLSATPAERVAEDSGYGGLKAYVGATMRAQRYSLAGSYGVQFGTRGATTDVDFVKHLGELSLTARLSRPSNEPCRAGKPSGADTKLKGVDTKSSGVHRTLALEARLDAGAIQSLGRVPVSQMFFGGNVQRNFIEGDNWKMLSGPFIRSIPENRLNSGPSSGDIGGTSFYSANFTLSREAWGHPILPKEVAGDASFCRALEFSKNSAREGLRTAYLAKVPDYMKFARGLASSKLDAPPNNVPLREWLNGVQDSVASLPDKLPAGLDDSQKEDIQDATDLVKDAITVFNARFDDEENLPAKLSAILIDPASGTCREDDTCSSITTLQNQLDDLAKLLDDAGLTADATAARAARDSLKDRQAALVTQLRMIDTSKADELAAADMDVINPVIDSFVNELNLVAVSPVGVFDVARVWPDRAGTRYGVGGGVRLSVVNLNVTLGYAFNPKRQPHEGRGAFFFSLDFMDIFRR